MRKSLFLTVLALLMLLSGCVPAFWDTAADESTPPGTIYTPPANEISSDFTEETPPVSAEDLSPEPPQETEPPVQAQFQESWTELLNGRTMTARHYFIYDCESKSFLLTSGDTAQPVFPASVTKLFTSYVALHYILPDEVITAGSELAFVPFDSSVAGLQEGDTLTVAQLIEAMMLPSGNDATYVLTTALGRILAEDPSLEPQAAMARFVEQMNIHAAILGLTDTHFVSPDGWHDENHYTSMEDLVKIGMLAWTHPVISQYTTVTHQTLELDPERTLEWENTNLLLDPEEACYCPYAVGLKTGFTTPAGNCLLSAFRVGEREVLIGVFGCPNGYDRFSETLLLFTEAFDLEIPKLPPETEPNE